MPRPSRAVSPGRATAIALVLLVHGLLLLLLIFGVRSAPRTAARPLQFISLWPLAPPAPPADEPDAQSPAELPSRPPASIPEPRTSTPQAPAPDPEASTAITEPRPAIDWQAEATAAARRQAAQPAGPETFSPPPKTVRKPCEPPESSFEWNPEPARAGFTRTPIPLPFVRLGERCVVGLGFFGCAMGSLPEPNSHLFDDLKEGKKQASSVPDPNTCD